MQKFDEKDLILCLSAGKLKTCAMCHGNDREDGCFQPENGQYEKFQRDFLFSADRNQNGENKPFLFRKNFLWV